MQTATLVNAIVPSSFQSSIFGWVVAPTAQHLVIEAVAGSGKTTTIVHAVGLVSGSVRFLAFNKSIATTIAERVKKYEHVEVSTMHSLGLSIIRQSVRGVKVEPNKVGNIAYAFFSKAKISGDKKPGYAIRLAKGLVSFTKQQCSPLTDATYAGYFAHFGIAIPEFTINGIPFRRVMQNIWDTQAASTDCDFDDMVFLPVHRGLIKEQHKTDWLFVDEVQDLNSVQQKFIVALGRRIVAVGDSRQAIYGFAGADTASMETLRKTLNADSLPLSICYRCPSSVVAMASKIVPQLLPRPDAPVGHIHTNVKLDAAAGDMVLCRTNAPLMEAAFTLLSRRIPVCFVGKELCTSIEDVVSDWGDFSLQEDFERWDKEQRQKLQSYSASAQMNHTDLCGCLRVLLAHAKTKQEIRVKLTELFADKSSNETVNLMSIHKSKGLEAPVVWILRPDLLPHPAAKTEWERGQETNLRYVAYTRAMEVLNIVKPPEKIPQDEW